MPTRSNSPALTTSGDEPRIQEEQLLLFERRQIPPERGALATICRVLSSKATNMPASFILVRPIDQRLEREHGLAAARSPHDQGRATARQAAAGDLVESLNAGGRFGNRGLPRIESSF